METRTAMNTHLDSLTVSARHLDEPILDEPVASIDFGMIQQFWMRVRMYFSVLNVLIKCYSNPVDWVRGFDFLRRLQKSIIGRSSWGKLVQVDGYYYTGLYTPPINDPNFKRFIATELFSFKPHKVHKYRYNQVFWAITKKCPMQCEHCSAWDTLNQKDTLGIDHFIKIQHKLSDAGTSQVYFTGGEPLLKSDLLEALLKTNNSQIRYWIATSGFNMTQKNVRRLKKAGLRGCFISLDHHNPEKHDAFRNTKGAYVDAINAAKIAISEQLVVVFSVCLRKDFCTNQDLMSYMELARETGVHFVQFFEAKAVGNNKSSALCLPNAAVGEIEDFYLKLNFERKFRKYPFISYHGYYERRIGCLGAGKRGIYIDADGNINACPFCQKSYGNILEEQLSSSLSGAMNSGCTAASSFS